MLGGLPVPEAARGGRAPDGVMIGDVDDRSAGTITFLFTDVEGSTRLWEQFPDEMKGALERHDSILRAAIDASRGRIVKTTGDGMMAVFERAGDAAAAGLTAQRALAAEPWSSVALRVRMGLHAGQAEQRGGDFFGPTVNRTARTMAAGHGGQILLSDSATALASDHLPEGATLLDLGEHRLRDLGRAEHVFQLLHPDLESSFPPLSTLPREGGNLPTRTAPFVGRQSELRDVMARFDDPAVRMLTLTGPGGTGKTTLAIRAAEEIGPRAAHPQGRHIGGARAGRAARQFVRSRALVPAGVRPRRGAASPNRLVAGGIATRSSPARRWTT